VDTQLKQRLIGGAVLVALAVIFLPMLVQGPAPDSGVANVSTRVPDAPADGFETRELPLAGPAATTPADPAVLPAPAAGTTDSAATEPAPVSSATTARPEPTTAAGQWAVTFGAYASARDADAVLSRLRQAGLEGFREEATVNGRQAWRVRVGPYADRALAEAGRLQAVRIRSDVNAQVIALDAGEGAPAAAAATTATTAPAPAAAPASTPAAASQTAAAPSAPAVRTEALPADTRPAAPQPKPAEPKPAAPKPAATAAAPATTPPAASKPAAASATPAAPAASGIGFAVQMGAFSSAAEANALRDRLRTAGFSAIVQPVRTDKGTLNRVRVGPVSTRAEAEQLKSRLAGGFGAGMVVPHP